MKLESLDVYYPWVLESLSAIVSKSLLLRIFQAAFDSGSGNKLAALDSQSLNQKYGGRLDRCLFSVVNRLYRELFTRFNLPAQCSFSQMLGTSVFTYVSCHFCATGHRLLWSSSMPLDIKHVVEGMQKKLFVYCFSSFTRTLHSMETSPLLVKDLSSALVAIQH